MRQSQREITSDLLRRVIATATLDGYLNRTIKEGKLPLSMLTYKQLALGHPVIMNLDLMIENTCGKNCNHCFFPTSTSQVVSVQEIENWITTNSERGNLFLYPREITAIPELLPLYAEIGQTKLITHAYQLTPEMIDLFKKHGITTIMVGLHGDIDAHCAITNTSPEKYYTLLNKIKMAAKAGLTVETFFVAYSKNFFQVAKTAMLAYDLGVKQMRFLTLMPIGKALTLPDDWYLNEDQFQYFIVRVAQSREKYSPKEIYLKFDAQLGPNFFSNGIYSFFANHSTEKIDMGFQSTFFCPAVRSQFLATHWPSGKIFPCFTLTGNQEHSIGNIQTGIEAAIANNYLAVPNLDRKLQGKCSPSACPFNPICMGGCRTMAYLTAKKRGDPHPELTEMPLCLTRSLLQMLNV